MPTRWRGGGAGAAQVVAAAHQVAQPFLLRARRVDEGQLAGAVETHQLARVAAVGLDPVARAHRGERGGDDVAGDADRSEQPVELVAARAGLVADGEPARVAESLHEAADGFLAVLELDEFDLAALRGQDASGDRVLVHVQRDERVGCLRGSVRANVRHDWPSFSVGGSGRNGHLNSATLTRDRNGREGQPGTRVHND